MTVSSDYLSRVNAYRRVLLGGDDFYGWFLGPRMIYTSGIVGSLEEEESLEKLQDNKLTVVCEKVCLLHFQREPQW